MQALVRAAIGLRPDRLAVHELAGAETAEVLATAGRGLSQVIMSTRANTDHEGLTRLASLVGLAGGYADPAARLAYVASSLELILTVGRLSDGTMAIVEIAEADLTDGHLPVATPILSRDSRSGRLSHTGIAPRFFAALQRRGLAVDDNLLKS